MALFDFLKRKKEIEKSKKPEKKAGVVKVEKKIEKKEEPKAAQPVIRDKKTNAFSYEVIKQPHISEKASDLAEKNQYIFEVSGARPRGCSGSYNKQEVKKSVEGIYGVDVLSVNMIKIPAKKRRLGKTEGFRKAYKKAVVKIKEGQKIEIL